ncbi:MAG: DUF1579 domain-containing protein [Planctomycetes bacterium]|nr:DUF1579 domain-containing protein [Planctomycetota bacterium]
MNTFLKLVLTAVPVAATTSWVTAEWFVPGQEPVQEPAHEMDAMAIMDATMKLAVPGKEHVHLAEGVGNWNSVMRMRMDPNGPWTEGKGKSKVQKALGGRYLVEKVEYEFMGMKTEGLLVMGYDNLTKKFQSVWMDSMSTGMTYSEGVMDKDGVMEMFGTMRDVVSPKGRPFSHRTIPIDDDHFKLEMFDTIPAKPGAPMPKKPNVKVMELEYSRVK